MSRMGSGLRKSMVLVGVLALVVPLLFAFAAPVSAATVTVCSAGPPTCNYATITTAVAGETYPVTINVYPGTYNQSVDLFKAGGGDITLNAVNAGGTPTPGAATVDGGGSPAFYTSSEHSGNITIDGFIVESDDHGINLEVNSDIVVRNVTASGGGDDGIHVGGAGGNVTIANCKTNSNADNGIDVDWVDGNVALTDCEATENEWSNITSEGVDGNYTITRCTATKSVEDCGIDIWDIGGNVEITDCVIDENNSHNLYVREPVYGNVIVTRCTANSSVDGEGFQIEEVEGDVEMTDCTANGNDDENFDVDEVDGNLTISGCTANGSVEDEGIYVDDVGGNVTISDSTANNNEDEGIDVNDVGMVAPEQSAPGAGDLEDLEPEDDDDHPATLGHSVNPSANGGDVTIKNCTTNANGEATEDDDGIEVSWVEGKVTISSCIARDNLDDGIDLSYLEEADSILVNGNIICGNVSDGLELAIDVEPGEAAVAATSADASGNWWGCAGGPGAAGCDTVNEIDGSVDFTPWIQSFTSGASVDPATAGSPTNITFLFSGGPPAVYLGKGPGDLHGDPTFLVTTDNGVVTSSGFIGDSPGTLEVTLTPAHAGTATVWVDGPCGLDESIVLGVVAAVEFVPEPGSVMLLGSGLVGLAGYAGLRLRKR